MTISTSHSALMRISSVELKTRLGHYLRTVEQTGELIEVCVRGRSVAALHPHESALTRRDTAGRDASAMNRALEGSGLRVEPARQSGGDVEIRPLPAGDGRTDINTVEVMREAKDW